ncbi:MAG: fused MFS/spermidine synthase [Planctomycetota bacterium]
MSDESHDELLPGSGADEATPESVDDNAPWMRPYDADLSSSSTKASGAAASNSTAASHNQDAGSSDDVQYSLQNPPEKWKHVGPDWHRVEKIPPVTTAADPARKTASLGFLLRCNLLVFLSSVCIMVLELTASRLIAKHVGSSLYTWTSVIGVVLAGITVGNIIGGWLAERFRKGRVLGWLFFLASAACLSVLWLDRLVMNRPRPDETDWPTWVFILVAQMFFLPAAMLGTISPVVASLAIRRSRRMGLTVGNVYAWGALGSIIGTFLTGFWLIDQFGTRMIIGGTAGVLAVLGIMVTSGQFVFRTALVVGWLQFLIITTAAAAATSDSIGGLAADAARTFGARDSTLQRLATWYYRGVSIQLDEETRAELKARNDLKELVDMDPAMVNEFRRWCRSGNRNDMSDDVRLAAEALIAASDADAKTVRHWRTRGEQLGLTLNELGLLLNLRSDLPGEYHDESNYSYINVASRYDEEFDKTLRQLRLDKLVHSYFDPESPTELYYEYEQIYAEVTQRVTRGWDRTLTVNVPLFDGRDNIVAALPVWATLDAESNSLAVTGTLTDERRRELLALAPPADYWRALEELAAMTRDDNWGGFSSIKLDALPDGADADDFLNDRLTFEPTFKTLNVFRELSDEDVERLCVLGAAGRYAPWRDAVNSLATNVVTVDSFFIGGGGFVFPRWIEHHYSPQSRIDVAELDPAVKLAVQREMGLPPDDQTQIRTLIGDARNTIDDLLRTNEQRVKQSQPPVRYDFIYGDAFNDFSVPWHLTTREFAGKVQALLKPETGVYMINIIDLWPRTVWPHSSSGQPTLGLADGFPAALTVDIDHESADASETYWDEVPRYLSGFEASAQHDGTQHFAVRGVMPESLLSELKSLAQAEGSAAFNAVLDDLYRRSKKTRGGRFLASCAATLAEVFPHVYVFSTSHEAPFEGRDTFVLVAAQQRLQLENLEHDGTHWTTPPFAAMETSDAGLQSSSGQMDSLLATSRGLILTDDFAPVDNLLQPVFERQDN